MCINVCENIQPADRFSDLSVLGKFELAARNPQPFIEALTTLRVLLHVLVEPLCVRGGAQFGGAGGGDVPDTQKGN